MQTKKCSYCKKVKSSEEFKIRSDRPWLLRSRCNECSRKTASRKFYTGEKLISYRKRMAENARKWRKNNPEYTERNYGIGRYRFYRSKYAAERKGCSWKLSKDQYYEIISKKCHYCGGVVETKGIGLDRLNNSVKCYETGNVVACCGRCNWIKCDWFTEEQMLKIGAVIRSL